MLDILDQDIQFLPGVGPRRKALLEKELGIKTYKDLLEYYPYKYVDRSRVYRISELSSDTTFVQIRANILSFETFDMGAHRTRLVAHVSDGTGVADIVWFSGAKYMLSQYKTGVPYIIFGKPTVYGGRFQFAHPDIDPAGPCVLESEHFDEIQKGHFLLNRGDAVQVFYVVYDVYDDGVFPAACG